MPRLKQKEVDSREFSGQTREIKETGAPEGSVTLEPEPLQVVEGPDSMKEAEALAFAEDQLLILIHQSGDKNQEDPVPVGVNGRMSYIWRGQKTLVKRKYVERLLRAQADAVEQDTAAREECDFNRLTIRPTQRYPLSVLHDPHPHGDAWLQQITQQA